MMEWIIVALVVSGHVGWLVSVIIHRKDVEMLGRAIACAEYWKALANKRGVALVPADEVTVHSDGRVSRK